MSESIAEYLSQIARGLLPGDSKFSINRFRGTGTPMLWQETFSIELDGNSRYESLRSFVDAAGWPIGIWEKPSDEGTIRALAQALLEADFLNIQSDPVAPGGEVNTWACSVEEEEVSLSIGDDAGILIKMSPVDLQLRRIANDLIASKSGAALNCHIMIVPGGTTANIQVTLVNEGNQDFQIQNPLATPDDKYNFLRIEIGAAPEETPGVTGSDIAYEPMALPNIDMVSAPWDRDSIVLKAGEKLAFPFTVPINLKTHRGHYIRGIYSHYGNISPSQDIPLVRGRVFSNELQIE